MKQLLAALMVLSFACESAFAGPNAGGVLIVHDTGITFSAVEDLPVPPASAPPAICTAADNNAPPGTATLQTVWKVYASFPDGSSPRVKALAWGIYGLGSIYVTTAGLPDPPNCFEVISGSWPSPPGSIGQVFDYPQTSQMVECYWFGGYAYQGAVFATGPPASGESVFVDDAVPGNIDAIVGFSSIGFGVPGQTTCPCCPESGACCLYNGDCVEVEASACEAQGGIYQGDDVVCVAGMCQPVIPAETTTWGRVKATYR